MKLQGKLQGISKASNIDPPSGGDMGMSALNLITI